MRNAITSSLFGLIGATALLAGCPDRTISKVNPQQGRVETKDIPVTVNRDIDMLFLVDDSPSMADKQNNLATNFPNFINVLSTIPGGLPNVHLGVVTSDLGTKGADGMAATSIGGSAAGACSSTGGKNGNLQLGTATGMVTGTFISDVADQTGTRQKNYTGMLATVFGAMAKVGASGCGFEQHLEAAKRALNNNPANQGFLRPSAYLAVIFVQDEDDCSMAHTTMLGPESAALGPLASFRCTRFGVTCDVGGQTPDQMNSVGTKDQCHSNEASQYLTKVADYVTFFKALKTDPDNVIVAGIAGVTTPVQTANLVPQGGTTAIPTLVHSCTYQASATDMEVADPAVRLEFFLNQFPNRSTFTTICQKDLSDGLQVIAQLLKTVIGDPCIEGVLADVDPVTPGDQYDCSVSDVTNPNKANQTETIVPACNAAMNNFPCWHLVKDTANCAMTPTQLTLKIERNNIAPPPNTHEIANCVTVAM